MSDQSTAKERREAMTYREDTGLGVIELDDETIKKRFEQLNELLVFQNTLVEAADMPEDLAPEMVLPWFLAEIARLREFDRKQAGQYRGISIFGLWIGEKP